MRAVIYARFSSHAQKDASIEQQVAECREYARRNDISVVGEYCDRALTGTTDKRPEFLRMIKDAAKEKWSLVLIWKTDRFARNRYDSAMYKAKLKKHHIRVVSVKEAIPDGPEGILLESVLEGSAEYYSANLSQNVMRGMRDNALNCKVNGSLPIGYVRGLDGRYAIDPVGAEIVREIFQMYADGTNATTITNSLNTRGLRTSHGAKWNKNSLCKILKNENYIGVYHWGDVRVENGVPAIVTKELFESVQRRAERISRAPAAARADIDYILTGKLFCGFCGKLMTGISGTSMNGTKYHYYACSGRIREKNCKKKPVRYELIERLVVEYTRDICLSDPIIKMIVDAALNLQKRELEDDEALLAYQSELSTVEKGIRNVMNAIEQGIITPTTKRRLEELEARKRELEFSIADAKIEHPQLTRDQLTYWLERFRNGNVDDPEYRSTFIDAFISAVYLYDDELRVACNFTNDGKEVTFPYINKIEADERSVELFVHASCGGPAQN